MYAWCSGIASCHYRYQNLYPTPTLHSNVAEVISVSVLGFGYVCPPCRRPFALLTSARLRKVRVPSELSLRGEGAVAIFSSGLERRLDLVSVLRQGFEDKVRDMVVFCFTCRSGADFVTRMRFQFRTRTFVEHKIIVEFAPAAQHELEGSLCDRTAQ